MKKIELSKIVEALEIANDESDTYFNKQTLEIYELPNEYFQQMENLEMEDDLASFSEWEKPIIEKARDIEYRDHDNWLALPSKYDIYEYNIMKKFCYTLPDFLIDVFIDAITRKGAFRNFRYLLDKHHLTDKWYKYKQEALTVIAIEWCEENEIAYVDDFKK